MRFPVKSSFWKLLAGFVIGVVVVFDPLAGWLIQAPNVARAGEASKEAHENPCPVTGGGSAGVPASCGTPTPVLEMGPARQYALKKDFGTSLRFGMMLAALDAMTFFTQTVAYDTAEWVASGFKGQGPGIFTDPFGEYTKNLLLDATGEFMGSFSENFTKGQFGIDLCKPPNFPELSLEIALGLPGLSIPGLGRPRPKCAWTDVVKNWDSTYQSLSGLDVTRNINANFSTGGNDLSFGIGAHLGFFDAVAAKRTAGILQRMEGQGFKPVTDFISGQIETPSQLAKRNVEAQLIEAPGNAKNAADSIKLNAAFSAGLQQMGLVAASTFTNVLVTRLLAKVKALLKPKPDRETHTLPDLENPFAASTQATKPKELFASQYSDLLTPRVTKTEDEDMLGELSGCAQEARGKWNCTIDESFALALRAGALTVRQAIDQGFINQNWQLIPSSDLKNNQDPTCRSRAFCAANLRKLRLARIIPVGWELAADSPANQNGCAQAKGCLTLGEAMRKFDDCNAKGELDKDHPYCHLIDPNWVLTAFPAQCQTKGFSNVLFGEGRMEECQDTALCLQRDDSGKCSGGYGYCMAEQTFWQFSAPKCQEQYASCRTYQPRGSNAKPASYLRSTLDYGACNASNVGCMWYAAKRLPASDDGWDNGFASTADRVYFDKTMLPCDAKNDGCTGLRRAVAGQPALNLAQNGSFENATGTPKLPTAWKNADPSWNYTAPVPGLGVPAFDGAQALYPPQKSQGAVYQAVGSLRPLRQYTLSFYARRYVAAPEGGGVAVKLYKSSPLPDAVGGDLAGTGNATYFRSVGCSTIPSEPKNAVVFVPVSETLDNEWTRFSCSFVTTPDTGSATITIQAGSSAAATPLIDAVKLEESETPTAFQEGLNQSLETVNLRIPPDELNCQGGDKDPKLCQNFARACKQAEAGCQGYRSLGQPSLPEVPAVLTPKDMCPAECVGYAEFRKQASTFDLVRDLEPRLDDPEDDTVAAFIPSTADSCAAQDVGCEKFTNLEALALGGESEAAFNYLRACEKPGADSQTFYTWEGSDTTGYQLKTWSLKRDTTLPVPQPPKIIVKAGPNGALKDPGGCNQSTYLQAQDPDCRQFYDPEGHVFYRFESQTVLSTEDCRQFRKDNSTQADCEKTGGSFLPAGKQCLYLADLKKSASCDLTNAGCRAYIGTQGKAQAEAFSEDFTSVSSTALSGPNTKISQSDESVLVGDKSLKIEGPADSPKNTGAVIFPVPIVSGALYELTFWAKTADPARPAVKAQTTDQNAPFGKAELEVDWKTYRLGPFIGTTSTQATTTQLTLSGFPKLTFLDKVRVSRVADRAYVVKDSWDTPAACDRTPEGVPQPQAMLGCQAYVDRNKNQVNARQFTRLCKDTAIGCTAYVNTRNSDTPYALVWEKPAPVEGLKEKPPRPANEVTVRPADRYDYYIEDKSKTCPAAQVSCRAFGLPQFTQDRTALVKDKSYKTVYLLDDVKQYDEGLCSEKELFCESYTSVGGTDYFRAPADHACEYRKAVVIDAACNVPNTKGATFDGWFKAGATCPCYPDLLKGGGAFGIRYAGDPGYNAWTFATPGYRGWTGLCPDAQAECTEFRDVADRGDPLHPLGRPYFVLKDNSLDTGSCNGQADPARGCVLFRDLSDTQLLWSTEATSREYAARAYQPVNPINCVTQPNHPACQQKVCVNAAPFLAPMFEQSSVTNAANLARAAEIEGRKTCEKPADCQEKCPVGNCSLVAGCALPPPNVNTIVKVKPDRACSEWLACSTGETVYDPQQGKYRSICTDLQLCNRAGEPESAGVPFCSNYVNRKAASELLKPYTVLDAQTYSARPTGFGQRDYSGVAIPDQFQLLDTRLVPIGAIMSEDPRVKSKFKKDYRLAVPMPYKTDSKQVGMARKPTDDELKALSVPDDLKTRACVLVQTGAYGFLDRDGITCWVALDQGRPPELAGAGAPITSDNLNVPNLALRFEQGSQPAQDQVLSRSFPNTQCKAAPQGDSPFGNQFVLEWDDSVTPPKPKRTVAGYGQTNLCEYGEGCECVYKRVQYGGLTRFYAPLSTSVLNALCAGGAKDGLPCTLDRGIKRPSAPVGTVKVGEGDKAKEVKLSDVLPKDKFTSVPPDQGCGEGGTCTPITASTLVRGVTGQCLQYDAARVVAGDQTRRECLFWNPNPVLAGPGDQFHWSPKAGWQPPQSSGRYYCASPVRKPQTFQLLPASWWIDKDKVALMLSNGFGFAKNSAGTYAGDITSFFYADSGMSDDIDDPGYSLDGHKAQGTKAGSLCAYAANDQQPSLDTNLVRLVTTGAGDKTYAEYAVLLDTNAIGQAISGGSTDSEVIHENTLEDAIAKFNFGTDYNKIGCEYSEEFGFVGGFDYKERSYWEEQDRAWQANFKAMLAKGGNQLDRRNAQIVTEDGTESSPPVKVRCRNKQNGSECYLKTWQLNYNAEGEEKFKAFGPDIGKTSMDSLSVNPVYGKCFSSKSWFSIRAVFEDTDKTENAKDPDSVNANALAGPFQLVGFWVTTCSPSEGPLYIYMYVSVSTSDVCRELAETISKDSHDAAAFTDRNSERGGFAIPKSGFTWGTTNVPFGASLATRDAGIEPLYMEGVKQAASNPLHPPTFTFPGQTYFRPEKYPTSNWGMLSNVFARIYRIYGYFARGVTRSDWACTDPQSPNFGQWCPKLDELSKQEDKDKASRQFCGFEAKCVGGGVSGDQALQQKVCNSFSGVNRGLDCTADPDICHRGPAEFNENDGVLRPQYEACEEYKGETAQWTKMTGANWKCNGSQCPSDCAMETGCPRGVAMRNGAFRCSEASVRGPSKVKQGLGYGADFCTKPDPNSRECPRLIEKEACVFPVCAGKTGDDYNFCVASEETKGNPGQCEQHPWAECRQPADCHFKARNFWPSGPANAFFLWGTGPGDQQKLGVWLPAFGREGSPVNKYYGSWPTGFTMLGEGGKSLCYGSVCPLKKAFAPATAVEVPFFGTPIAPAIDLKKWSLATVESWNDKDLINLFPGFSPQVFYVTDNKWCSPNFGGDLSGQEPNGCNGNDNGNAIWWEDMGKAGPPYGHFKWNYKDPKTFEVLPEELVKMQAHYGACEPLALMFKGESSSKGQIGTCRGGARAGSVCQSDTECLPLGMTKPPDSSTWCNPVTSDAPDYKKDDNLNGACWTGADDAKDSPAKQDNPALDNNICTHPPGYWPRPNLCLDPNDEYCGLFGYDITAPNINASVNDGAPLPTDVTPGLYTPRFLNPKGAKVADSALRYNYLEFYNPVPPQVAAPDMRTCTGGQCRVSGVGTIGVDGLNEGIVNGGAGGHVAALRFYAWAGHDQMPLRRIVIDWGDGAQSELPDAFLKNRKPYCQTEKECTGASGLTCSSDSDCPPGAGQCAAYGSCAAQPNVKCFKDAQCDFGDKKGVCNPRVFFGNDQDACDEQYFEFRHAYACLASNKPAAKCQTFSACSNNPSVSCGACSSNSSVSCDPTAAPGSSESVTKKCAVGDRCVVNMSAPGGCSDEKSNTCRFTPRVMVTDNWGWCAGECRGDLSKSGVLVDAAGVSVRHPNGGCFDASNIRSNASLKNPAYRIGDNECSPSLPAFGQADAKRPWIVFPGAVQLLTGETK